MSGTISDWVQNLGTAHGEAAISYGGSMRVRLVMVPPEERHLFSKSTCASHRAAANTSR
jgi:hypothetical protein